MLKKLFVVCVLNYGSTLRLMEKKRKETVNFILIFLGTTNRLDTNLSADENHKMSCNLKV